jgi:hypothetical protein
MLRANVPIWLYWGIPPLFVQPLDTHVLVFDTATTQHIPSRPCLYLIRRASQDMASRPRLYFYYPIILLHTHTLWVVYIYLFNIVLTSDHPIY